MRLYFGGTPLFAANGARVTARTAVVTTSYGLPVAYDVDLDVMGYLEADGQAALTAAENALRATLSTSYRDLALRQDSGVNSALALPTSSSISGVRIVDGPHFEEAEGAEYVNRRTVKFTGRCRVTIRGTERAVMHWEETLTFVGDCGPVTSFRQAVNARPVQQVVFPGSTMKVTQRGKAVGHLVRPTPPPPLWGFPIYQGNRRRVNLGSGERVGPAAGAVANLDCDWSYEFESAVPLVALPNLPPL